MAAPKPRHLTALACPRCRASLEQPSRCDACGSTFPVVEGVLDYGPPPEHRGLGQAAMESRLLVTRYESWLRPALTRLVSGIRPSEEETWLQEHVQLGADGPILDLACGTGRYTRVLAKTHGDDVIGLDLSQAMVVRASQDAPDLLFVRGDAMALPFLDASLSAVNSSGSLHLFPDPVAAIAEVGRVLAPGGSFTNLSGAEATRKRYRVFQPLIARTTTMRFLSRDELAGALAAAGMELLDWKLVGMMAFLAARKA